MPKVNNNAVLIVIVVSAVLLVGFIVYLSANGKDTGDAIQTIALLAPLLILNVLNTLKISKVENQTNGSLTQRLTNSVNAINAHTTATINPSPTDNAPVDVTIRTVDAPPHADPSLPLVDQVPSINPPKV